jgi:hypothetical protein
MFVPPDDPAGLRRSAAAQSEINRRITATKAQHQAEMIAAGIPLPRSGRPKKATEAMASA